MTELIVLWGNLAYYGNHRVTYPMGNIGGNENFEVEKLYVVCRTCGYEREVGVPCGEPCV